MGYFPQWKLKEKGVVAPDERLPTGQTVAMGVQHVVAMFGSTILAPILMGFDPNMAVLMSGIGTLIFSHRGRQGAELSVHPLRSSAW